MDHHESDTLTAFYEFPYRGAMWLIKKILNTRSKIIVKYCKMLTGTCSDQTTCTSFDFQQQKMEKKSFLVNST